MNNFNPRLQAFLDDTTIEIPEAVLQMQAALEDEFEYGCIVWDKKNPGDLLQIDNAIRRLQDVREEILRKHPIFNRQQLIVIVKTIFNGFAAQVQSSLPPVIPQTEFAKDHARVRSYIEGCLSTVASQLPCLYACLTNDGMGTGDFVEFEDLEKLTQEYIEKQTRQRPGYDETGTFPDTDHLAYSFVARYFSPKWEDLEVYTRQ